MSKYDSVDTAMDLIHEVISHGLSTETEDRNRAADIFGRTSIGELDELANSREQISGKFVGEVFYFIAFHIWNWLDACNFWNKHTNFATKDNIQLREENKRLTDEVTELNRRVAAAAETANRAKGEVLDLALANENQEATIEGMEYEILTLKAKLYDLIA